MYPVSAGAQNELAQLDRTFIFAFISPLGPTVDHPRAFFDDKALFVGFATDLAFLAVFQLFKLKAAGFFTTWDRDFDGLRLTFAIDFGRNLHFLGLGDGHERAQTQQQRDESYCFFHRVPVFPAEKTAQKVESKLTPNLIYAF
jgi:hypothetical protein